MKNTLKRALALAAALCMCLLCSCAGGAEPTTQTTATTPMPVKTPQELEVILHAGGGMDGITHLNAQETFEYYYSQGYRYFEYDMKLSSDGRIIATHAWENLNIGVPDEITYEEFCALRLTNGYTPANEDWIIESIKTHPDVKIVVDAKMDTTQGDAAVLARLEELEKIHGCDISANIIPEVFSKEMWDIVKETTTFDAYLFSQYKVYYTVGMILEYFDDPRIMGVAFSTQCDSDLRSQIYRLKETKKIFVFTALSPEEVRDAAQMGADAVYVNFTDVVR